MNPMLELLSKLKKMDIADRLSALSELADQDLEDGDHTSDQDAWDEMDPDEHSYEELLEVGEIFRNRE
ncbi:unnamed protein product [Brassica rapa]|uniref:Uncharacterized protein n=2 Tax=Brassica TaxID=3705 RepID=A0A8D9LQ99_BRACM|nr:unnamed protein product [Brassica napus]CAG7882833.1 unnamed protein product [Brassica rapa]